MTTQEDTGPPDVSDLNALFISCTLKRSPERSNTEALMGVCTAIMRDHGVAVDEIRLVDHPVADGVQPDMTRHGWERDAWPDLYPRVQAADVLVVGTPIWLGAMSSVCSRLIQRLYAHSGELNDKGQSTFYGKVGGVVVTGNEDGIKHVGRDVLYSLQHLGFLVPPQVDAGWIGDVGPGPSYLDEGSGGPEHDFAQRNVTFLTWNLLHLARMLKDAGGIPRYGNDRRAWDDGERFGHPHLS